MSRNRVVDPYYLKRAAMKGIPVPPQEQAAQAVPVAQSAVPVTSDLTAGDIYQQGSAARLAQMLEAQKQAAEAAWLQSGGLSPSGQVYRSPSGMIAPGPSDVDARGMLPLGGGSGPDGAYDPRGIPASVETAAGPKTAVQTGNPFFDVNTNFSQLEKERQLKNQNDAVFSEQNNRRLGAIAEARNAADALRAANLAGQGMTQEQIDMRMHPERFAAPKDPAIEQAKAIDLAERQGRGSVDAMARKFMRNGLSPAQAYAAAFNSMPTTNPANQGAVPSLPGMDPMRVAGFMGAGPGMAAGQYGVGMERSGMEGLARGQESRDRLAGTQAQAGAHRDVGLAQAGATAQNGTWDFIINLIKAAQGNKAIEGEQRSADKQMAMQYMGSPMAQVDMYSPPGSPARQRYDSMAAQLNGAPAPASPASPASPAPGGAPLSSAFSGSSSPAFGGADPKFLVGNPAAMQQWLSTIPEGEREMRRVQAFIEAGMGSDPSVGSYLKNRFAAEDPNLFSWYPDSWASSYTDAGTPSLFHGLAGMLGMSNGLSRVDAAAQHAAQNYGVPADVARQHYLPWFNQ